MLKLLTTSGHKASNTVSFQIFSRSFLFPFLSIYKGYSLIVSNVTFCLAQTKQSLKWNVFMFLKILFSFPIFRVLFLTSVSLFIEQSETCFSFYEFLVLHSNRIWIIWYEINWICCSKNLANNTNEDENNIILFEI